MLPKDSCLPEPEQIGLEALQVLFEKERILQGIIAQAVKLAFPVGSYVYWLHGRYEQCGRVEEVDDNRGVWAVNIQTLNRPRVAARSIVAVDLVEAADVA